MPPESVGPTQGQIQPVTEGRAKKVAEGVTRSKRKVTKAQVKNFLNKVPGKLGGLFKSIRSRVTTKAEVPVALTRAKQARDVVPELQGKVKEAPQLKEIERGITLGKGSYGEVYMATNPTNESDIESTPTQLRKEYVVKEQSTGNQKGVIQEATKEVALQRKSPGAVQVTDERLTSDGRHQVMMEHGGTELKALIHGTDDSSTKTGALPQELARDLSRQLATQMKDVHAEGIIHRDIKPDNILVNNQGKASLADFGVSEMSKAAAPANASFQSTAGTIPYMAPEVMVCLTDKNQSYSMKADVWSMGLVMAEMMTGIRPNFADVRETKGVIQSISINDAEFNKFVFSVHMALASKPEAKDLVLSMIVQNPAERLSSEDVAKHPYFTGEKPMDQLSYPELQTKHQARFSELAQAEKSLSDVDLQYKETKAFSAFEAGNHLRHEVKKLGEEVNLLQSHIRIKEQESQVKSLEREAGKVSSEKGTLLQAKKLTKSIQKELRTLHNRETQIQSSIESLHQEIDSLKQASVTKKNFKT